MTDNDDDVQHRTFHQAAPGRVELREEDDESDGVFRVRMPIATTGEVRNEGDDPLTRDEIEGMASQVDERAVGVFLDHGQNPTLAGSRYSATEKAGEWEDPELQDRESDGETELVATASMMDPDTLPESTGPLREALSVLKEQVKREMSLSSSIGWRDDDAYPGGVDLMETSIVGIGADPRTTSHGAAVATARDVLSGTDLPDEEREALVAEFEAAVMGSTRDEGRTDDTTTTDMTDESESADDADDTNRDEQDSADADEEYREFMRDQQEQQTEILRTLAEALREDGDDDEDDEEEDEDDDEDGENSADVDTDDGASDERTVTIDGEERSVEDALADLREQADEAEPAESQTKNRAEDDDSDETTDGTSGFGFAGAE